jgi:outer membrane biosynthesis protein TonB
MSAESMPIAPEIPILDLPMATPEESDIDSNDFDSEMSESESGEEEEVAPPLAEETKTKKPPKAKATPKAKGEKIPRKKAVKKEKIEKIKKPRTIRRPYKAMDLDKLVTKQAVASGRFDVVSKRMISTQNQLERFNYELAFRKENPVEEQAVVVADEA